MRLFALVCLLLVAAIGWSGNAQSNRKIAPGDKIRMSIPEEPSLSKAYTVTNDGLILIDFLGAVQVSNLTLREAADKIANRLLADRVLRKATIGMEFLNEPAPAGSTVKVTGAVKIANPVPWAKGMRLADIIKNSIPENNADLSQVVILRADKTKLTVDFAKYNPANNNSNPEVMPGDEVQVPVRSGTVTPPPVPDPIQPNPGGGTGAQNPTPGQGGAVTPPAGPTEGFVFVIGGVNKPGSVPFRSGMLISDAIAAAGGFSPRGDRAKVRLERSDKTTLNFDLTTGGGASPLKAGDQVIVETVGQKRYIQVNGSVTNPGLVEYTDGMTLSQAIMEAGGLAGTTQPGDVAITSSTDGRMRKVSFGDIIRGYRGDTKLSPGDILAVGGKAGTGPAPQPRPTSSKKRTTDTLLVAGAAALFIWLLGR